MAVRDIDRGARDLLKRVLKSQGVEVRVGVMGSKATALKNSLDDEPLTVVEVAAIHEFGAPEVGIESRSWLRDWCDINEKKVQQWKKVTMRKILLENTSVKTQWNRFGLKVQSSIQERIEAGIEPGLKESTIAKRGDGVPLIHTGQFKSSITYLVLGVG